MAVEIPLRGRYRNVTNSSQKSRGGNSGSTKVRRERIKGEKEKDQAATKANQKIMHLAGGRKRTWIKA